MNISNYQSKKLSTITSDIQNPKVKYFKRRGKSLNTTHDELLRALIEIADKKEK